MHEPIEQLAPMPECSTVKPKGELVEGIVQLLPRDATLRGPRRPAQLRQIGTTCRVRSEPLLESGERPLVVLHTGERDRAGGLESSGYATGENLIVGRLALVADGDAREFAFGCHELHGVDLRRAKRKSPGLHFIGLRPTGVLDFLEGVGFLKCRAPGDSLEPVRIVLYRYGEYQGAL